MKQIGMSANPARLPTAEIDWAAEHDFGLIDITIAAPNAATERGDWPDLGTLLRDRGIIAICRAAEYLPLMNASPIVRQAALDELRRTVDVAQVLGARLCTLTFAAWQPDWPDAAGYEAYRQLLSILVNHGAAHGVAIALENGMENAHQLKYFREIMQRVPALGLALDIGRLNMRPVRGVTRDWLFAFADRLQHVRVSDNDGAADQRLPFGAPRSNGVDLVIALGALRSFGYTGTLSLAIDGDRRYLDGCREMVRAAWDA